MPTLSYVISSVLLISPFIAAGILSEVVENDSIGFRESNSYGQWLVVLLCAVSAIVILRILTKELTIASMIEGAKMIRLGRKGVTLDQSKSDYSIARLIITVANIPGYCFSYLFFPNSNIGYYLGVIVFYLLVIIFTIKSFALLEEHEDISLAEKNTYAYSIIFGSLFVFIALRFFSDSRSFEAARLTREAAAHTREIADTLYQNLLPGAGNTTDTVPTGAAAIVPPEGTTQGTQAVLNYLSFRENQSVRDALNFS